MSTVGTLGEAGSRAAHLGASPPSGAKGPGPSLSLALRVDSIRDGATLNLGGQGAKGLPGQAVGGWSERPKRVTADTPPTHTRPLARLVFASFSPPFESRRGHTRPAQAEAALKGHLILRAQE